jgi:hypothetical protein
VLTPTKEHSCVWCGGACTNRSHSLHCSTRCKDARNNEIKARRAQALGLSFRAAQRHYNLMGGATTLLIMLYPHVPPVEAVGTI